jgi:HPt (histidine-containing phosphotransfer) domain-containing protein
MVNLFIEEVNEDLSTLSEDLQNFKNGKKVAVENLFRVAHKINGNAGMLGFDTLKQIAYQIDKKLYSLKKGEIEYSDELYLEIENGFAKIKEEINKLD